MNGQSAFVRALLDPDLACPPGVKAWNGSGPDSRFAVYRNNVVVSLVDSLAESFPVVQALVGEEFFRAMASVYVRAAPPRSRVLAWYGEGMADFIAHFSPADPVPYLADMARLEMSRIRAFHAADQCAITPDALRRAQSAPGSLFGATFSFRDCVQVVSSRYAVHSLWGAHQDCLDIASVNPFEAETALIFRTGFDVQTMLVPAGTGVFLGRLLSSSDLTTAADAANEADENFNLTAALATLIQADLITAIAVAQ